MPEFSLFDLFEKAGVMRWPLLLASVMGLAVIVDRTIVFIRSRFSYERFRDDLSKILDGKPDVARAIAFCESEDHVIARVAGAFLRNVDTASGLRSEIVAREGSIELERLEKRLRMLAAIAHLAPLMGLLGTVMGMVAAFARIGLQDGVVQPGDLAGGIWEALLTTVFGLAVAIPCMAAYHAFESHVDSVSRKMRFMVTNLEEWLGLHSGRRGEEQSDV